MNGGLGTRFSLCLSTSVCPPLFVHILYLKKLMTTAIATKRRTIRFDSALFPELMLLEYASTWATVGFRHLDQGEGQRLLSQFIVRVQPPGYDLNEDEILLVRAEKGILKRVYGPCVFQGEKGLILKLGTNSFPVDVNERDFICGELKGDIESDPSANPDYPVSYLRLSREDEDSPLDWLISVRLSEGITASDIRQALRRNETITGFFLPPPGTSSGAGSIKRMQELGEGEFEVERIDPVTTQDQRESWVIHLKNGEQCWARGKTELALKNGWTPDPQKPLTLRVANIRQKGNATHLDCAFVYRLPKFSPSQERRAAPTRVETSAEQQVMRELDQLMARLPQGQEKARIWASQRGYSNRADMPLEVLLQLQSHLEKLLKPVSLDEIPF